MRNESKIQKTDIPYETVRSYRRTISVEVKPGGKVIVRAPFRMAEWRIRAFVDSHDAWIRKNVQKMEEREEAPELSEAELAALRKRAREYIPLRVEAFAKEIGVRPTGIRFTSARTRWGSCSAKDSLSFSVRLMNYPAEAIDYVIVHELCHIREHNHSPKFWALVSRYMPDYRERQKLLKK